MHGAGANGVKEFPFAFAPVPIAGSVPNDHRIEFDPFRQIRGDDDHTGLERGGFFADELGFEAWMDEAMDFFTFRRRFADNRDRLMTG